MKVKHFSPAIFAMLILFLPMGGCAKNTEPALSEGKKKVYFEFDGGRKTEFFVEIVSTLQERARGLMYRKNLAENAGMFFVFEQPEILSFWMKNTLIPLDIIFLDSYKKVINIKKMALPCVKDPCPLFYSTRPAQYVLEIGGGLSDKLGIAEGAKADLSIGN